MTIKTDEEQLEEVQAAMSECLTAQELGTENGRVLRVRFEALQAREAQLLARIGRKNKTGGASINRAVMGR